MYHFNNPELVYHVAFCAIHTFCSYIPMKYHSVHSIACRYHTLAHRPPPLNAHPPIPKSGRSQGHTTSAGDQPPP